MAICYDSANFKAQAEKLADELGLKLIEQADQNFDFILHCGENGLSLVHSKNPKQKPLLIDFTSGKNLYRRLHGGGKNQPIAKALGIKSGTRPTVIDATAGLGQDSFVLASLGCEVYMIERSPIVAALLQDALNRAAQDPETYAITQKVHLFNGSAESLIPSLAKADAIYLDPMFPDDKKTALAKKEMQILQALLEKTDDNNLFSIALGHAKHRVVVKRPKIGPFLNNQKPSLQMIGSSNRFDIYLKN
ncbi:MAG: hypothetical protein K0R66_288 [Gammaproteobacteria bacterium]|nr:hypothetical protein [Gammaproteobacteria bacterium]